MVLEGAPGNCVKAILSAIVRPTLIGGGVVEPLTLLHKLRETVVFHTSLAWFDVNIDGQY